MDSRAQAAGELMMRFAERTGLTSDRPPQRYLWTDAFAVCNFFALAQATGESRYRELALGLIDQVHHVLGRHRPDAKRSGWISGLDEREGEAHPTRGGLRIGKRLPERRAVEPLDERLEWDRDGQYFHYLTKWMHALDQSSRSTRQPLFNAWARELAAAAHAAFVRDGRMCWKMSIDLSRPLVASMGHHDPLDGYVTCTALASTAARLPSGGPSLAKAIADFERMIHGRDWATGDPLGIGGLLMDAARLAQIGSHAALIESLLRAAGEGLRQYARRGETKLPASRRLAFRELGLAIGLHALRLFDLGKELAVHAPLGAEIEAFWRDPHHRRVASWSEHRDINEVMLATSLVPEGFLVLPRLE